ncbi:MAG: hypothetical protein ACRBEQ_00380 [Hyphomonas sp.]
MTETSKSGWMGEYERRQIRLRVLLGQGAADIARALGRDRTTIKRQISKFELDAPPEPLEVVRLELELAYEAMALRGLSEPLSAAERTVMLKMSTELRQLEKRAAREVVTEEVSETGGQGDGIKWDADGLWSRETCERVLGHVQALTDAGSTGATVEVKGQSRRVDDDRAGPLCVVSPQSADAARGRLADMVVYGRTWRWKDAGGGGMGALGDSVWAHWPCGPDRTGLVGRARGDD